MNRWKLGALTVTQTLLFAVAVLAATIVLALVATAFFGHPAPEPVNGALDLRTWDFSRSGSVPLGGTWSFLPDRFVDAPSFDQAATGQTRRIPDTRFSNPKGFFAGTGSGTYRLRVLLPANAGPLGLRYSTIWSAFEAEANGVVVARAGVLGSEPGSGSVPPELGLAAGTVSLPPMGDRLDVVVRVSNRDFRWGGIARPLVLGSAVDVAAQKRVDDLWVLLLVGTLTGIAANSLFLFVFRRRDLVNLSFAMFALMTALRAMTSGDNLLRDLIPGLPIDGFLRLEYFSLYSLLPLAALFFAGLFPQDIRRAEVLFYLLPPLAFCLLIPFAPLLVLSWSVLAYFVLAAVQLTYGYIAACLRPAFRHRPGSGIVLTTGTILVAAVLFNFNQEILQAQAESFFPMGMIAFVLVQALVMAKRLTWAFETAESLTQELKASYRRLSEEAREAEEARDGLAEVLAEKDILLKEVHHRVRNSLQIVLSIINLQVKRTKDPGALAAYSSVRDRIRAISSVHNRLFGLDSEKRVDLPEYVQDLITNFTASYADARAEFAFEADAVQVPMDLCLEVGLIVTELVLNSYAHAVIPAGGGRIQVALHRQGGELRLRVVDEGPGFPDGFAAEAVPTIGFKIILTLVQHRGGTLTVSTGRGACVEVRVPLPYSAG